MTQNASLVSIRVFMAVLLVWLPGTLWAEPARVPGQVGLFADRQPLFATQGGTGRGSASLFAPAPPDAQVTTASLFAGTRDGGLFSPLPERLDRPLLRAGTGGSAAMRLRDLIARAEAGRAGYDAVQHGAVIRPPLPPTRMTIQEIHAWIRATPGQPHAIGRYQFIPSTLRRLVDRLGLDPGARFSPDVQDRLADLLLEDAGLSRVQQGVISEEAFMLNLAKIWAGLPTSSGRSYYDGFAGNKATMPWEVYAQEVRAILNG
ncbi:hypothetical protein [Thetidibacter halocola]|uniref:Muramidase (Phage lambda lysozyme) n=1 Tax=Thetidibacter halocola TaxID=2827239 RepID=A0A8J7WEF9_9RHOB|nr:hypothetical protein [Thetidibacter halocola]MBS0123866.1 hypothetical protein [Thetidibacter halocola]